MAKQKNPYDSEDPKDPKHSNKPKEPDLDRPRPKHKPQGREHEVHKEILARRMRGGPEPTADAYLRALEQWKNLPGSVVRPPTDVTSPPAQDSSEPTDQKGSVPLKPDTNDQKDKGHQP